MAIFSMAEPTSRVVSNTMEMVLVTNLQPIDLSRSHDA